MRKKNQVPGKGITCSGKLVFMYFQEHAKRKRIAVSIKAISISLSISPSAVSAGIRQLKKAGYVSVQPTFYCNGLRGINVYRIEV